jgi:hypothetical protein
LFCSLNTPKGSITRCVFRDVFAVPQTVCRRRWRHGGRQESQPIKLGATLFPSLMCVFMAFSCCTGKQMTDGKPDGQICKLGGVFFVVQQCCLPLRQTVCGTSKTPLKTQCVIDPLRNWAFTNLYLNRSILR